ncbi:MAG: DUF5688 family protein [Lachnospiraceae bacterium]|nr:DUF5688 family protein [Lachnospiraceae bacterium]
MDIRDFAEMIKEELLPELQEGQKLSVERVTKNNDVVLWGLRLKKDDRNVAPTVYINSFYADYKTGGDLKEIKERLLEVLKANAPTKNVDLSFYTDFDKVKDRIAFKLVNKNRNEVFLKDVPYKEYLDLAIVFYYVYTDSVLGEGSILVREPHIKLWGVDVDTLYKEALKNTPRLLQESFEDMGGVLKKLCSQKCSELERLLEQGAFNMPMYVLGNRKRLFGAAVILYPGVLGDVSDVMGGDFFVLPSSVHETIVVTDKLLRDSFQAKKMIREINITQLEPEDVLSDSLYFYDHEKKLLEIV